MNKQAQEALEQLIPDGEKRAAFVKEAEERNLAFSFGLELALKDLGIEKAAYAQALGVDEGGLVDVHAQWLMQQPAAGA